jgi:flagellar protein FlbD
LIELTLLSGKKFFLNPHQIETAESNPDTTLHLLSGKSIVVKEDMASLRALVVDYRRSIGAFAEAGE